MLIWARGCACCGPVKQTGTGGSHCKYHKLWHTVKAGSLCELGSSSLIHRHLAELSLLALLGRPAELRSTCHINSSAELHSACHINSSANNNDAAAAMIDRKGMSFCGSNASACCSL